MLSFVREIVRVIRAISVDIDQSKAVIAEDTPVAVDAVGKVSERHAIHSAVFTIEIVYSS